MKIEKASNLKRCERGERTMSATVMSFICTVVVAGTVYFTFSGLRPRTRTNVFIVVMALIVAGIFWRNGVGDSDTFKFLASLFYRMVN